MCLDIIHYDMNLNSPVACVFVGTQKRVPSMRIELTTLGLLDPRSNQLSYEGIAQNWSEESYCTTLVSTTRVEGRGAESHH